MMLRSILRSVHIHALIVQILDEIGAAGRTVDRPAQHGECPLDLLHVGICHCTIRIDLIHLIFHTFHLQRLHHNRVHHPVLFIMQPGFIISIYRDMHLIVNSPCICGPLRRRCFVDPFDSRFDLYCQTLDMNRQGFCRSCFLCIADVIANLGDVVYLAYLFRTAAYIDRIRHHAIVCFSAISVTRSVQYDAGVCLLDFIVRQFPRKARQHIVDVVDKSNKFIGQ